MGRIVSAVHAPDDWFIKGGADAQALALALEERTVVGLRRTGKLLMMDFGHPDGPPSAVLGLRFGMTGRLTVAELAERGGSHTGDLHEARIRGGSCPRDAELLDRRTIGGRTTYSCPLHQH